MRATHRSRRRGRTRRWRRIVEALYARPSDQRLPIPSSLQHTPEAGFLELAAPLIRWGQSLLHDALAAGCGARTDLPFEPATAERLCQERLLGQLIPLLSRTLVLEMRIAGLEDRLRGASGHERFRHFVDGLRDPGEALRILEAYPVLADQLCASVRRWLAFSLEFLQHLAGDWAAIRSTFHAGADPGKLVSLSGGVGDSHRGGKAVLIAEFEKGHRIVYKPRSMAVDAHFQELLQWLNRSGDPFEFRTFQILDRGDHGWVEFLSAEPCDTEAAVRRFYERQGAFLALLYALEAADFHRENLIAVGEHPMLLDLEALFHPPVDATALDEPGELAGDALNRSVLRVGLLPLHLWDCDGEGIDLSGLTGRGGQLTPFPVACVDQAGTDDMAFVRKRIAIGASLNQPSLHGAAVDPLDYVDELQSGFIRMYRSIVRHRRELLEGPLQRFAEDEVRVVFLPTQTYGLLLTDACHPDFLRDAADQDRLFHGLWAAAGQGRGFSKLVPAQIEDLQNGDIPIFTTRPGSRDVWTSAFRRIPAFFQESGLDLVEKRLATMGEEDLARQIWVLQGSLATISTASHSPAAVRILPRGKGGARDRSELVAAARAIGERLEALAFRSARGATWIGLTFKGNHRWSLAPLGFDLYSGLSGVVLFLAHLGSATGEERFYNLARLGLHTLRGELLRERPTLKAVGGFQGWGGAIYTLSHLGALWSESELIQEADSYVEMLPELIAADTNFDIIGGSAGCAGGLSSLHRVSPSSRTTRAAIACGERLVAGAERQRQGIAWVTAGISRKPLAGFSHGAAGIAWALMQVAVLSGEQTFRSAALAALDYEHSLFSPEERNWRDLREGGADGDKPAGEGFAAAWCHGAPGIGLARVAMLEHLDAPAIRSDIRAALNTTMCHGFGGNHSLCHGAFGNADLLIEAARKLGVQDPAQDVNRIADVLLESVRTNGPVCGSPMAVETPGLMTGLAGIGYGFLRLADPDHVPSILAMQPPATGQTQRVHP